MRLTVWTALLLAPALSAPLWSQTTPRPFSTERLRFGPDTFDIRVSGGEPLPGGLADFSVRSLSRGTGADRDALIDVTVFEQRSSAASTATRTVDTVVVGAADLRLRRISGVLRNADGTPVVEFRSTLRGTSLEWERHAERNDTTASTSLGTNGAPYATPFLLLRAAPLSKAWRGDFPMYGVRNDRISVLAIDSVRAAVVSARPVWLVHAHVEGTTRLLYTVDSTTRDMISLTIVTTASAPAISYVNRRYTTGDAPVATTDAAVRTVERSAVVGHYFLEGVREVGSELLLRADGTFEFMLAYGALDESGSGTWRVEGTTVVLQSAGVAHPPSVKLRSATGVATDSIRIVVVDTAARPLSGIGVNAAHPRRGRSSAQTRQGQHVVHFEKGDAPTEISIGVDMLGFMVPFPIGGKPKALYQFVFDQGDLATRRFEQQRLDISDEQLVMTMNGRRLTYIRH